MESIFDAIRAVYTKLGRGEKKVADALLKDADIIVGMSINELAEYCGCGDATIVRFSRRLGLSGYQALKVRIFEEKRYNPEMAVQATAEDDCFDIWKKYKDAVSGMMENTEKVLSARSLENAAEALLKAKRIAIFGTGQSITIAAALQHSLMYIGLNATAYTDGHLQMVSAANLCRDDVAIGISLSGCSVDIVEALTVAKEHSATTIAFTKEGITMIDSVSDIKLCVASDESNRPYSGRLNRIVQLSIVEALSSYLALRRGPQAEEARLSSRKAVERKMF